MKNLIKIKFKKAKVINKQHFLLRCRKQNLIPKQRLLKNTQNINSEMFNKFQDRFLHSVLNQEISETFTWMKINNKEIDRLSDVVAKNVSPTLFQTFLHTLNTKYENVFNKIKRRHRQKIDNMLNLPESTQHPSQPIGQENVDKWLINLTNVEIPTDVNDILRLGDKYSPPISDTEKPFVKLISNVESAFFYMEDTDQQTEARNRFVNILTNFNNRKNHQKFLSEDEIKTRNKLAQTKKFLKDNPDLLITRADKGNITVITTKIDYVNKINDLLQDKNTYEITTDSSTKIQNVANKMITLWENEGRINAKTGKDLRTYNGTIAKLYGLPKIHKNNVPFRPIVSSIGTPLYSLSSFLSDILNKTVGKSPTNILNAEEFKNKIKDVLVPPDHKLLSLDVVSLFTNIDSKLVVNLVRSRWKEIKKNSGTKLTQLQFIEALKLVLGNCEFSFENKIYKQKFGSPMGSPVSPAAANLVMEYVESTVLSRLNFKPLFFYRYVDDVITAVPSDKVDLLLTTFNNFNKHIKFTIEMENDNHIPFLDVSLHRNNDGSISTDWFHKKTWSGRYLHFSSWLPKSYKRNTISILTEKVIRLSDRKFQKTNFGLLEKTLLENGYPKHFIKSIMKKTIHKLRNDTTPQSTPIDESTTTKKYVSIPYIKGLFERTKFLLQKYDLETVGSACESLNIGVFSKLKDKVPLEKQSNVVYQVVCDCGSTYTGQTKQHLKTRINQHKNDATHITSDVNKKSALSNHIKNSSHTLSLNNVKVIDRENNYRKRSILEMIHIKKSKNSINKQTDSEYLKNYYDNIIKP